MFFRQGKVCVVTEPEAEPVNLSGREVDKVCEISGMSEVCASLETLSKVRHLKTIFLQVLFAHSQVCHYHYLMVLYK